MRLVLRHQSGKWDMPIASALAGLAAHREHCSVLTGTEANASRWDDLLAADGWEIGRQPGEFNSGDPWVSWDTDVWESVAGWTRELSGVTYDGRRAHARAQILRPLRGRGELVVIAHHLPAHIGRPVRVRRTSGREVAYQESLDSLAGMVRRVRRNRPDASVIVVGDWNLNFHNRFACRLVTRPFRRLDVFAVPPVAEGSRGSRLIDWALTDMHGRGRVLEPIKGADHRGVEFTLREVR